MVTRGIRVGIRGIGVGMQGNRVGIWGISVILFENLRLKSRSAKGAFHHPAFKSSRPTISHTLFALSTNWMSSPSRK